MTGPAIDMAQLPFADIFPRLYELRAAVPDLTHPDAYFQNFVDRITESEHIRYCYTQVERPLALLDASVAVRWHSSNAKAKRRQTCGPY